MKKMKKIFALLIAMIMVLGMSTMVFAQDIGGTQADGKGQIKISNAAKGETYTIYKLFDATLGENGEVAYKGSIPSELATYFEETSTGSGYVKATAAAVTATNMSDGLKAALKTWANAQSANAGTAVSDGTTLNFNNLDYGYYVVTTTQGEQLVSVDTTMPTVSIIDKNTTTPTAGKKVDGQDTATASIGDTVTFTATFDTTNYIGEEQVKSYTISDTLPPFLGSVAITEVKIVQSADDKTTYPDVDLSSTYTNFTNKQIIIPWVDNNNSSLYKNGSVINITYTAVVTSTVNINGANTNKVTLTPNKDKEGKDPFKTPYSDTAVVNTYGAALKKVDDQGNPLKGAEFTVAGLVVEAVTGEPGVYRVVSYNPESTTPSAVMTVNDDGKLYIIGLASDVTLKVTESKAPDGYNKLTKTTDLTAQVLTKTIYETSGTRYYDADGNLYAQEETGTTATTVTKNYTDLDASAVSIVNEKGVELPSTGGIGTTIFYIIGAILVIGAGVVLVTRRRMNAK